MRLWSKLGRGLALTCVLVAPLLAGSALRAQVVDDLAGRVDAPCLSDCVARGVNGDECTRICLVPPDAKIPPNEDTDAACYKACRKRGGGWQDCLNPCRRK
jgi:hypothetical protein